MAENVPSGGGLVRWGPEHVRKTIAFDGAAGNGAVGTVIAFVLTGRVKIEDWTIFCTKDLVGSATVDFGVASQVAAFMTQRADAEAIDANEWVVPNADTQQAGRTPSAARGGLTLLPLAVSTNPILTIGAADITDGTLVIDLWYRPITTDGKLVGD